MSINEPSDELKPPTVTIGGFIARTASKRTLSDYVALAIATCGVGYLPLAPGTWGSLVGVGAYLAWRWLRWDVYTEVIGAGIGPALVALGAVFMLLLTMAGVWAATRVERLSARKDPGIVVIDEVVGQLITFMLAPVLHLRVEWPLIIAGFLLFRIFDIWKPYPIRRLEALESGLGIMADDVLAGMYAATALSLLTLIYVSLYPL